MSVELRQLRYFVAVAEELNFTRAAARLHLSQQSLSQAIALLERHIGIPLLARSTRAVTLTAAGAGLLDDARALLAQADEAVHRARDRAGDLAGQLQLGCSFDLQHVLTPLLRSLRSRQPHLDVDVTIGTQRALIQHLRASRIDAALTWRRPAEDPDLRVHSLLTAPLLAVVRDDDPLAAMPPPLTRDQIATRPLIIHRREAAPGPYDEMIEQLYPRGRLGDLRHIDVLASGHEARLAALREEPGVALMASFAYSPQHAPDTVALDVTPPMIVTVDLLWLQTASDSTSTATSYLAALAHS